MCCLLAVKDISHRIGPIEEAVLKLPLLVHTCAAVLLTYVWICANGGHPWCEEQDMHDQHPYIEVNYCHIYCRVGGSLRRHGCVASWPLKIFPTG